MVLAGATTECGSPMTGGRRHFVPVSHAALACCSSDRERLCVLALYELASAAHWEPFELSTREFALPVNLRLERAVRLLRALEQSGVLTRDEDGWVQVFDPMALDEVPRVDVFDPLTIEHVVAVEQSAKAEHYDVDHDEQKPHLPEQSGLEALSEEGSSTRATTSTSSPALKVAELQHTHADVRRIAWKVPAFKRAVRAGHDPDDLLQDVYLRLLTRQAYDPARGTFGRWVWVVVTSVVRNYRRDHAHKGGPLVDELPDDGGGPARSLVESDRSLEVAAPLDGSTITGLHQVADELDLDDVDRDILARLAAGELRRDIRPALGLPVRVRRSRRPDRVCDLLDRLALHFGDAVPGAEQVVCDLPQQTPGALSVEFRARSRSGKNGGPAKGGG